MTTTQHTWTFTTDETPRLRIDADHADVRVHHDAQPGETTVHLTAPRAIEIEPIDVTQSGREIALSVPPLLSPEGGPGFAFQLGSFRVSSGDTVRLSFEVHLPPSADLDLQVRAGDLHLEGRSGSVKARTGGGDVRIDDADDAVLDSAAGDLRAGTLARGDLHTGGGDVTVESLDDGSVTSAGGDVRVERLGRGSLSTAGGDVSVDHAGQARIKTGGGDVLVRECAGDLTVTTGGGDVRLGHCPGRTEVNTGAGDVSADVVSGTIAIRTGAGDIAVRVPADVPVWQDLTSSFGEVHSGVSGRGEPSDGQEFISVTASTGTGDITLY